MVQHRLPFRLVVEAAAVQDHAADPARMAERHLGRHARAEMRAMQVATRKAERIQQRRQHVSEVRDLSLFHRQRVAVAAAGEVEHHHQPRRRQRRSQGRQRRAIRGAAMQ